MPINLSTINSFYGITLKPFEVEGFLRLDIEKEGIGKPANFEEMAIMLVGRPEEEKLFDSSDKLVKNIMYWMLLE